jgi:hypothetical protein
MSPGDSGELWRDRLAALAAPPAPPELIARVVAERSRGARAAIPSGEPKAAGPMIRPRVLAAAVVVLVAGAALLQRWPAEPHGGNELSTSGACGMTSDIGRILSGSVLFLSVACGQEPGDQLLAPPPPAARVDANALRGGTWIYGSVGRDGQVRGRDVYQLSRYDAGGEREWLSVFSRQDSRRTRVDTLHFASDGVTPRLRIVRRTVDGRDIQYITMTYDGPRVEAVSDYPGYPSYQYRLSTTLPAELGPIASTAHGPGCGFAHIVQVLPLRAGWEGSVYVAPLPKNGYRTEPLRVTGDGTVRVPAGTFDCWRVAVGPRGQEWLTLWVSKDSRYLVKEVRAVQDAQGPYTYETVLVSYEPS